LRNKKSSAKRLPNLLVGEGKKIDSRNPKRHHEFERVPLLRNGNAQKGKVTSMTGLCA
jgi:hypothetical protein